MSETPQSYLILVLAAGETTYASNGLRFATREAAERYAVDLACRWTQVREWEIAPSNDQPNR